MSTIFEREKQVFLPTYKRISIEIKEGRGAYLIDKKGDTYLDFFSGLAVNALGHAHPKIVEAVSNQISKFAHLSNYFITDIQIEFAEKLIKYSGMAACFLSNSGTEANEAAIKMIRYLKGPDKIIYSLSDSFHGRTYGALSLTARKKYQKGFEPLLSNTGIIKHNDIEDLTKKVNENTAAIFMEFIQGEGGINEVSKEFIERVDELRRKYNFILVADAIQDGVGRSGKAFVHEYFNFKPDLIVVAKAVGGGLPLGALLTSEELKNTFPQGKHGTTFGGNPVCAAAGKVVLEEIFENGLLEKVFENGNYFKQKLFELKLEFPQQIKEVRGKGYIIGVELFYQSGEVVQKFLDNKILVNSTNENVVRILPPLIINKEEIDIFIKTFRDILSNN